LFPAIVLFTCIGVMSVGNSTFDLWLTLIFGIAGFALIVAGFDVVPLVLGLILGAPLEENLRRTLLLSDGDFGVFLTRPIALVAGLLALAILVLSLVSHIRKGFAAQNLRQSEVE
jgi:TctA family transporter